MTTPKEQSEREAFKAWAESEGLGGQVDVLRWEWRAWQARAALSTKPAEPEDDYGPKDGYSYATHQATKCARCGKHKHTPLRVDRMAGYVCLTCIDRRLKELLDKEAAPSGASQQPEPNGYAYEYPFMGGSVLRFSDGQEVNGSKPIRSVPYWFAAPQAAPAEPVAPITDEQIEGLLVNCGGSWDGSVWKIEDADLHPFVRLVLSLHAAPAESVGAEPASEALNAAVDDCLGLAKLPEIRVGIALFRRLQQEAKSQGLILQAHVWNLLAAPQAPAPAAPSAEALDASRYRWLQRLDNFAWADSLLDTTEYNTLNAAVDWAMATGGRRSHIAASAKEKP